MEKQISTEVKFATYEYRIILQSEHKIFPWLQTFITRKLLYVEYKHIFLM